MVAPPDTLAYYAGRALTKARSMANVPCAHIAPAILKHVNTSEMVKPESCALWFYAMNHGMSEITKRYDKLEPLPADVRAFVEDYYTQGAAQAFRAFCYLMLICVRESRHLNSKNKAAIKEGILQASSMATYSYLGSIPDDAGAAQKLFAQTPPKENVVTFVRGLSYQFHNGSYSHGYGGPAWGNITDCLKAFVEGTTTAEVMLDTVWTLAHNNGAIFNKEILYTQHDKAKLLRVLDIQRSGQIPAAILNDSNLIGYIPEGLREKMTWLADKFGVYIGSVDWLQVVKLGALGHYGQEIKAQKALLEPAPAVQKPVPQPKPVKPWDTPTLKPIDKVKDANVFYITPTIKIKKIKMARLDKAA